MAESAEDENGNGYFLSQVYIIILFGIKPSPKTLSWDVKK